MGGQMTVNQTPPKTAAAAQKTNTAGRGGYNSMKRKLAGKKNKTASFSSLKL
jgi:hypothetical protein